MTNLLVPFEGYDDTRICNCEHEVFVFVFGSGFSCLVSLIEQGVGYGSFSHSLHSAHWPHTRNFFAFATPFLVFFVPAAAAALGTNRDGVPIVFSGFLPILLDCHCMEPSAKTD